MLLEGAIHATRRLERNVVIISLTQLQTLRAIIATCLNDVLDGARVAHVRTTIVSLSVF